MTELADHQRDAIEHVLNTARGRLIGCDRVLAAGGYREVAWANLASLGVLLADEAGTGKTRIGSQIIDRWKEAAHARPWAAPVLRQALCRPTIVVTPASGRFVWPAESQSQVITTETDSEIRSDFD